MTSSNGDKEQAAMVFHPGEFIQDELIARRVHLDKLQCEGWGEPELKRLLLGHVPIDQSLADHLNTLWGIKQSFFFNIQEMWDKFPNKREFPPNVRKE